MFSTRILWWGFSKTIRGRKFWSNSERIFQKNPCSNVVRFPLKESLKGFLKNLLTKFIATFIKRSYFKESLENFFREISGGASEENSEKYLGISKEILGG